MKRIFSILLSALLVGLMLAPVKAEAAVPLRAGAVTTAQGSLNVRSQATTSSKVLTTLKKGSHVTLVSKSGNWWRVSYGDNQFGYCHASYITQIQGTSATVTAYSLNVRSGPGTGHSVQAYLHQGDEVVRLSSANGWSRILYHGTKTGYVSDKYLTGGTSGGQGSVSLKVPSFKQTDSRWASVTLGTSGKTMAKIGCATTAIAMMESFRQGKTIYPDAMARQLRYTASGNVYWPSHYTLVTGNVDFGKILSLLNQGKPVLFGSRNANGGQHWVVITGFKGGELKAENFSILDPGASRTTLAQFMKAYPNFYKYFHY